MWIDPQLSPRRWLPALAIAAAAVAMPAFAEPLDVSASLRLAAGYDSNGLRVQGSGPGAGFMELGAGVSLATSIGAGDRWFANLAGIGRRYGSSVSAADWTNVDLRTGFSFSRPGARWALSTGLFHTVGRSTFVDRVDGEIYRVAGGTTTIPPTPDLVEIPDRFDLDSSGLFADLRYRVAPRLRLFLDSRYERADYVEDYREVSGLDPLDYAATTLEPGVMIELHRIVAMGLSLVWTDLTYEDQRSLDLQGVPVDGTRREYAYLQYNATVHVVPTGSVRIRFGLRDGRRDDRYAGYYDFGSRVGYASIDYKPSERSALQAIFSNRELNYDTAVVLGDPNGETRGNSIDQLTSRFQLSVHRDIAWFVEAGLQRTESPDPVYAHDRDWMLSGIRYTLP